MEFVEDYFDLEEYKTEFKKQTVRSRVIYLRAHNDNVLEFMEDYFDLDEFNRRTIRNRTILYRKKNQNLLNLITAAIIIVSFAIAVLLYDILNYTIEQWRARRLAFKAQNIRSVVTSEGPVPGISRPASTSPASPAAPAQNIPASTIPMKKFGLNSVKTGADAPAVNPMFPALWETFGNNDIVAFITIEGTEINYPVVQSQDNDFYLSRNIEKQDSPTGSIFMDYENSIYPLSPNTVIYGHNMGGGTMFHDIRYYESPDFYKGHNIITMQTLYENTKWEVFAFYETSVDFNYIQTNFENEDSFAGFVASIMERAFYDTGVEAGENDSILTLSTCTNEDENTRKVLHAKRIE